MEQLRNKLKEYIKLNPNTYSKSNNLAINHPNIWEFIKDEYGEKIPEKCYNFLNPGKIIHECKQCKVSLHIFQTSQKGYKQFCNNFCSSRYTMANSDHNYLKSDEFKEKRRATLIKNHGTISMVSLNRDKIKANTLEKYGVDHPLKRKDMQQLREDAVMQKYGVKNVAQIDEVRDQIKTTMIERYGVHTPLASQEIMNKKDQTMIEKYGVKSAQQSQFFKDKTIETNLERYGVENPMQFKEISNRALKTLRQTRIDDGTFNERITRLSSKFQVEAQFTKEEYLEDLDMIPKWKHVCGTIYESGWGNGHLLICSNRECKRQSAPQREIYEHVKSLIDEDLILINDRTIIKPYELDIVIPSLKIAIEMDGIYWHQSDDASKKLDLCKTLGYQLIHITDLDWYDKTDIWKSIISSKLKTNRRIYARKCQLRKIDYKTSEEFLNEHHLQGASVSKHEYGLYHNDILVSVMTFGKARYNQNYEYELIRFASIKNLNIIGAGSRLLKAFILEHAPNSIISYSKNDYSNGNLYKQIGFEYISEGVSSYFYVKGSEKLSRFDAQKHKLFSLIGEKFDSEMTEFENMKNAGYIRVVDRGSSVYGLSI